jgi:acetylornithine aminotransferase
MVHLSPRLREVEPYPFEELDRRKQEALDAGRAVIDFGVGDPREETPALVRDALRDAVGTTSSYPRAAGLPALRRAIQAWVARRFAVELDPDSEILPTLGSKELVFSLAQAVVDPPAGRDLVLTTAPGYPIATRGARYAGADVARLRLTQERGFLPDLDAVPAEQWDRACLLWLNYPNNPTGAIAPLDFLERLADLSGNHGFLLASDEAYTELWFADPPHSALEVRDRGNVAVFNTLSKRSSMTGYRSGFAAADVDLIAALKQFRPSVGTAPQEFVQRASIVAWDDEEHVERTRAAYRRKRDALLPTLLSKGIRVAGSEATMFLWLEVPQGRTSEEFATGLLEHGLIVSPGTFFGPAGEGYWRMALVATEAECRRAAEILEAVL